MTFHEAALKMKTPDLLFTSSIDEENRAEYRELAIALHPDANPGEPEAERLFQELTERWRLGTPLPRAAETFVISTKRRSVSASLAEAYRGTVASYYPATWHDVIEQTGYVKLVRNPKYSVHLEREAKALRAIAAHGIEPVHYAGTPPDHAPYFPRLVDTARHKDGRRFNLLTLDDDVDPANLHSLAEVRAAYPNGIDGRDAAWMWRRLLVALALAHDAGIIHGSITPDHVLIEPEQHGLVLVGWGNAGTGEPVKSYSKRYGLLLPPELIAGERIDPTADLYAAANTMSYVIGDSIPRGFAAFRRGCTLGQASRPKDAWRLAKEFDELLETMYGPRRFREFRMPTKKES